MSIRKRALDQRFVDDLLDPGVLSPIRKMVEKGAAGISKHIADYIAFRSDAVKMKDLAADIRNFSNRFIFTTILPFILARFPVFPENGHTTPLQSLLFGPHGHITTGWHRQTRRESGSGFSRDHDKPLWHTQTASSLSKICVLPCSARKTCSSQFLYPS